ncbi:putative Late nodulin [Medicago truncatula]|uniref:Late nodulin n=1 Tax=Medicago truncatula TaxID=3880 RepID=G7JM54_MEDTR|nr:late nodulin [Medicago truncatula]AFK44325.1 unknown [Medicago truncatula]RHN60571.1 putative Late nodulin [Medicago truncatula]
MQRKKNMGQILIFVFALINFLSPILVEMTTTTIPCTSIDDCPKMPLVVKCIDNFCNYFEIK